MAAAWQPLPESSLPTRHTSGMSCHHCQRARKLERHTPLVGHGLADVREAERYALTPEERAATQAEERLLASLLERIEAERFASGRSRYSPH